MKVYACFMNYLTDVGLFQSLNKIVQNIDDAIEWEGDEAEEENRFKSYSEYEVE